MRTFAFKSISSIQTEFTASVHNNSQTAISGYSLQVRDSNLKRKPKTSFLRSLFWVCFFPPSFAGFPLSSAEETVSSFFYTVILTFTLDPFVVACDGRSMQILLINFLVQPILIWPY
jgi:hypothetical protein